MRGKVLAPQSAITLPEKGTGRSVLPDVIITPRLALRAWLLADATDVFAYAADEDWGRYLPITYPYSEEDAHQFVADQTALDPREHVAWAIEREGHAIGGVDLRFFAGARIAEIDYAVARSFWGRGFATEATGAVLGAAFQSCRSLTRIRAMIDARNVASARVLAKIGMTHEGTLRANRFERGEAIDEAWYGILRAEWENPCGDSHCPHRDPRSMLQRRR